MAEDDLGRPATRARKIAITPIIVASFGAARLASLGSAEAPGTGTGHSIAPIREIATTPIIVASFGAARLASLGCGLGVVSQED